MAKLVIRQVLVWSAVGVLTSFGLAARAAVDLSGNYRVDSTSVLGVDDVCTATVVQTGPSLDLTMDCWGSTGATAGGTIDPVTGTFSLSGTCTFDSAGPAAFAFEGVGASDSLTFTMSGTCGVIEDVFFATKCGNGTLDPGEECEDGNRADGDCCSATCTAETGTVCDAPSPMCTRAACDAAGTCVPGAVDEPAGTACDLDADRCTEDLCDGAGGCDATGEAVTCRTCETCDPAAGCAGSPLPDRAHPGPGECQWLITERDLAKARNDLADDRRDQLVWKWSAASVVPVADFGMPTAATDYTLCMFDGADERVLGSLEIPAGAGWSATSTGFKHKSRGPDGSSVWVVLKGNDAGGGRPRILVGSKGGALGYPAVFDTQHPLLRSIRIELRTDAGGCWASGLPRDQLKTTPAAQMVRFRR